MPLGLREMMLIVRARDQASGTLAKVAGSMALVGESGQITGKQLQSIGAGISGAGIVIGAIGAAGVAFFSHATTAASTYQQSVLQTKTQLDKVKLSTEQLADMGLRLARDFPVAFDQIQPTLYDIFSSMDVTGKEAETVLRAIAKTSVAGNTDMQNAGRATIAVLNAYQMKASDVSHVEDIMFQLVRKGVGTYAEFASSIGRAIPAAISSNQHLETLSATMAFLTRNGLSTAMAATSSARAFELIAQPKVMKNLEDMGVSVKDGSGNFRQMNDIITQLANSKGWSNLTKPELATRFKEVFGTGTAQARRFFNTAIPNWKQYNGLTMDMFNNSGQMTKAYKVMFDSPQNKMTQLNNRYHAMTVEIGQQLLPAKEALIKVGEKLLGMWESLSPGIRKTIVIVLAFVSVAAVLIGIFLVIAGFIVMVVGTLMSMGVALGTIGVVAAVVVGAIVAVIAVIVGIIALIYNWDTVVEALGDAWEWVVEALKTAWHWIEGFLSRLPGIFAKAFKVALDWIIKFAETALKWLGGLPEKVLDALASFGSMLFDIFETALSAVIDAVIAFVEHIPEYFGYLIGAILALIFGLPILMFQIWIFVMTSIVEAIIEYTPKIIEFFADLIGKVLSFLISLPGKMLNLAIQALTWLWNGFTSVLPKVLEFFGNLIVSIMSWLASLPGKLLDLGLRTLNGLWQGFVNALPAILTWLSELPGKLITAIGDIVNSLYNIGKKIIQGLWDGLKAGWHDVTGWLSDLDPAEWKGPATRDKLMLVKNGELIMQGLNDGLDRGWQKSIYKLKKMSSDMQVHMKPTLNNVGVIGAQRTVNLGPGSVQVIVQGSVDEKVMPMVESRIERTLQDIIRQSNANN